MVAVYSGDDLNNGSTSNTVEQVVDGRPIVVIQPADQTVVVGGTASFSAQAIGYPIPSVQWQVSADGGESWSDVEGATSTPLTFTAEESHDGSLYRAVYSNDLGSATSEAASLTVHWLPAITLDVALIHMNRADECGNGQFLGPDPFFDDLFCLAAKRRFMSCERIVPTEELLRGGCAHSLKINRMMVDGVVETPLLLVADDHELNVHALGSYLSALGYRLAVARNGAEAVERTLAERPDLVLMDLQMPGTDGLEAIRRIRASAEAIGALVRRERERGRRALLFPLHLEPVALGQVPVP